MNTKKLAICGAACLVLFGCSSGREAYDEEDAVGGAYAINCVALGAKYAKRNCVGDSVIVEGDVSGTFAGGYRISVQREDARQPKDFLALHAEVHNLPGRVRIKGVVVESAAGVSTASVQVAQIEQLRPLKQPARNPKPRLASPPPPQMSAEQQIAMYREQGARALEEVDAAIRQNNGDMKRALAAKALTHHVTNSDGLLVDVYGLPDGRHIACKTVVYDSGAPIVTCDGEP